MRKGRTFEPRHNGDIPATLLEDSLAAPGQIVDEERGNALTLGRVDTVTARGPLADLDR